MKKLISLLLLATLLLPVPGMGAAPEITTQYLPDAMVGVYYHLEGWARCGASLIYDL